MTGMARTRIRTRTRARAKTRARARARAKARARGGKIINTALFIPAGTIYTMEAPLLQGRP